MVQKHKYKRGTIALVMLICMVIAVIALVMVGTASESYRRNQVIVKSFQESCKTMSSVEIAASSLVDIINNREGKEGTYLFQQSDIESIKNDIEGLLGSTFEISVKNKVIEECTDLEIKISCGYIIELSNITLDTWKIENIIGYDENGPIIEYINMYRINTDTANISIKMEENLE